MGINLLSFLTLRIREILLQFVPMQGGGMEIKMAKGFEESIKELESIVSKLENPNSTLDETLEYFEKGIKLSNSCRKMLENAEKKVSVLLANENGELEKQDFIGEEE